ncbi:MAG: MarC family protein [Myxococcota bacterium]
MSLFSMSLTFFLILDSVGHIADFNHLIRRQPRRRQGFILAREMLIALLLLVAFHYFGAPLISSLGLTPATIRIAGGIVLFLIAIKMIFPSETRVFIDEAKGEPFIVPLATPMIAGPSILATVMFYASTDTRSNTVLMAILIAWTASLLILGFAWHFHDRLNQKALGAIERLMGLILTLLAVEIFLKGLKLFIWNQSI